MNFTEGNSKLLLASAVGVLGLGSLAYFLTSESNVSSVDHRNDHVMLPFLTVAYL